MPELRRSTISDVAEAAHVSISTVSLVMNGKGPVSEETRVRVAEAAERLGYVPSRAAQGLVLRTTGNVGFVLREDHFTRAEPFYTRIFLGSEFEARHAGVYVLLATVPGVYRARTDTPRFLRERAVDGVVVAGRVPDAFLDELAATRLPVVLVDFAYRAWPSLGIDNAEGGRMAARHLLDRGRRRLAFVGADPGHPSLAERLHGFEQGAGRPIVRLTSHDQPTRATGRQLGHTLFADAADRPDGVFCANDALALGVLDAARDAGVPVPEALSVVGFDDVEGAAESSPPLTTLRVFKEQLGELALRHLVDLVAARAGIARGAAQTRVLPELVVRGSS